MTEADTLLRALDLPAEVVNQLPADYQDMPVEALAGQVMKIAAPQMLERLPPDQHELAGAVLVGLVAVVGLIKLAAEACQAIPTEHRRKALLEAYRQRHRWRKADIPKLRDLGLTPVAERRVLRLAGVKGRRGAGRGVVQKYRPIGELCDAFFEIAAVLIDPDIGARRRLLFIRKTPVWPIVVERLYRGEYEALKQLGMPAASENAELRVADRLALSTATVRKTCTNVRHLPSYDPDSKPVRLRDFDYWLESADYSVYIEGAPWDPELARELVRKADDQDVNRQPVPVLEVS